MNSATQMFGFEGPELRTVVINGESWFVGEDIAGQLGYTNPQKAVRDHVDEDDRTVNDSFIVNGTPIVLINESGFFSLILSSKLPSAQKFKRWVTSEVLPTLRKVGKLGIVITNNGTVQSQRFFTD